MKIDFEFNTQYGVFRDALHLPDNHTFTDADLSEMKTRRKDNWINVITTPSTGEVSVDTATEE